MRQSNIKGSEMKSALVPFTALVLVICLTVGCSVMVETYTDSEQTIEIKEEHEFIIALDSNPTTGYEWEESHDTNMISLIEEKSDLDRKTSELVGDGGTQFFRFKALMIGRTEITLTYKRQWETQIAEQEVFTVDIK